MTASALQKLEARRGKNPITQDRGVEIPLDKIRFDPTQPRKTYHHLDGRVADDAQAYIVELSKSIEENGLIQSITVQEMHDGTYLVVVGECRTRAHMLLGREKIRAEVRNDLTSRGRRLLFQLAENVNRQDLTDDEVALSVRELIKGSEDEPPMTQAEIAKFLGKSEGYITRFIKFGDEELQRLWVKSGIADTVEKVYRLSILPKAVQVEIQRRVDLPVDDRENLPKPLNRDTIDQLAREVRASKKADLTRPQDPATSGPAPAQNRAATPGGGTGEIHSSSHAVTGVSGDDAIGQALAAAAAEGREDNPESVQARVGAIGTQGYQLDPDALAAIRGNEGAAMEAGGTSREVVQPPVNCRVTVGNIAALLAALQKKKSSVTGVEQVRCDLHIPGPLAQLLANELMGIIVDEREVPAVIQNEFAKLR